MTVGEACSPIRESRHEGHATTHNYGNGESTFERWEDNEREWRGGPSSEVAYKKVANEGKRVSIFEIITEIKKILKNRNYQKAIRSVASVPRAFISDLTIRGFTPGKQPACSDLFLWTQEYLEKKAYEERS